MDKIYNILIVGVGGQGVILASELLSEAAMASGFDAKKSEVHGMSQRGGVVSSHIRFGKKVFSPLIPENQADAVLAFEAAEGLRWAHQVSDTGLLVINDQQIVPPIAFTKGVEYPEDPIGQAKQQSKRVLAINALEIAHKIGNPKLVNTILIGAISQELPISPEIWEKTMRRLVPRGTEEQNLAGFAEGVKLTREEVTA